MNTQEPVMLDLLRREIHEAFPAAAFGGAVTLADGETNDDFSDERALYDAFHGKRWTEIPVSFVVSFAYALPLLTKDAFVSFLPAWLDTALSNSEVRDALLHSLAKEIGAETSSFMKGRVSNLNDQQMKSLVQVLEHTVKVEAGKSMAGEAQLALKFVRSLCAKEGPTTD
jgi:Family of unknown function (DUF6714)